MTNVHYLRKQLTFALDAIRRGLDALEAEPAAEPSPAAAETAPQITEDRDGKLHYDDSQDWPPLALAIQRIAELADSLAATHARTVCLERIVLEIDVDTCMKHGVNPF